MICFYFDLYFKPLLYSLFLVIIRNGERHSESVAITCPYVIKLIKKTKSIHIQSRDMYNFSLLFCFFLIGVRHYGFAQSTVKLRC